MVNTIVHPTMDIERSLSIKMDNRRETDNDHEMGKLKKPKEIELKPPSR